MWFGLLLVVGFAVACALLLRVRSHSARGHRVPWDALAAHLATTGLPGARVVGGEMIDATLPSLEGRTDDLVYSVHLLHERAGRNATFPVATRVFVRAARPLDVGFILRTPAVPGRAFLAPPPRPVQGAFGFHGGARLEFFAWERECVDAVLTPGIQQRALTLRAGCTSLQVDDMSVEAMLSPQATPVLVGWAVRSAIELTRALREEARRLPPSRALGSLAAGYAQVAAGLGLHCISRPLGLEGWRGDVLLAVTSTRLDVDQGVTALVARHRHPLGFGLRVEVPGHGYVSFLDGADIELGDREVDRRFRITGPDPEAVRALLFPALMERVAYLADRGQFVLDDSGAELRIRGLLDARDVQRTLLVLEGLAASLAARASQLRAQT